MSKSAALKTAHTEKAPPSRAAYPIPEARSLLGNIGQSHMYALMADGRIKFIKLGRRRLISANEIERVAREGA